MGISFTDFTGGSSKSNDFAINTGVSGNNVFTLDRTYDSGSYAITIASQDSSFDVYAVGTDGSYVGYANSTEINISDKFNKLVILGLPNNDQVFFEYRGKVTTPLASGSVPAAGAYVSLVSVSSLEDIDDTTTITGGNFANDVEVYFVGQSNTETAAKNIVVTSVNQLIVTRPDSFDPNDSPYTIKVVNPGIPTPDGSNLFKLSNSVTAGTIPSWNTGNSVFYNLGQPTSISLSATDEEISDINYSVISGTIPEGLSLDSNLGTISGTFSGLASNGDSTDIAIRATDTGGNFVDKTIAFISNSPPTWNTGAGQLASPNVNTQFSTQLSASVGAVGGTLTYSIISGTLPAGLSINSAGLISGSASQSEIATFTVRVTDEALAFADREFTISPIEDVIVEYLVIAGGGGGGQGGLDGDGAGGAGGYRSSVIGEQSGGGASAQSALVAPPGTSYTISIGGGGAINASGGGTSFGSVSTNGGGHGGYRSPDVDGANGGSGGGARAISGSAFGLGTQDEGFNGGEGKQGSNFPVTYQAGGGGGAAQAGNTAGWSQGGNGVASSITGTSIFRAGGGGADRGGSGGQGGGGNARNPGTANTGGGGGSRSTGGSGVVILRYPDAVPNMIVGSGLVIDNGSGGNVSGNGSRLSPSFTPSGYKVYMIKSGTGNVSW